MKRDFRLLRQAVPYPLNKTIAGQIEINPNFTDFDVWLAKTVQQESDYFEWVWEIICHNNRTTAFQNLLPTFWHKLQKGYDSYLVQLPRSEEMWSLFWDSLAQTQKELDRKQKTKRSLPLATKLLLWLGDRAERVEFLAQVPPLQIKKLQGCLEEAIITTPAVLAKINRYQLLNYLLTSRTFRLLKERKVISESQLLLALAARRVHQQHH